MVELAEASRTSGQMILDLRNKVRESNAAIGRLKNEINQAERCARELANDNARLRQRVSELEAELKSR